MDNTLSELVFILDMSGSMAKLTDDINDLISEIVSGKISELLEARNEED